MIKDDERWKALQPGDPWTFIMAEPVIVPRARDTDICFDRPAQVGDYISNWFATDEPERMFRVERITEPSTYETVFVGFNVPRPAEGEP